MRVARLKFSTLHDHNLAATLSDLARMGASDNNRPVAPRRPIASRSSSVMFKLTAKAGGIAAVVLMAQASPAQAVLGPDAAACRGNRPALLVNVSRLKARTGNIRVNVYGNDPHRFLARGRYVRQINVRASRSGPMRSCVALRAAGSNAVAVRHDVDGDGNDWSEGGGFSRNPRLSLTSLRPRYQNGAFDVGGGIQNLNVVLNYRFGLSVRPV